MATVYQKTDNYGLDLYGDNDPADLRDGHNTNMRTIDGKLKDHSDAITKNIQDIEKNSDNIIELNSNTYRKQETDKVVSDLINDGLSLTRKSIETMGYEYIVTIGDSMYGSASTQDNNWEYLLGKKLSLTVKNYAVGGVGFHDGDDNYVAQSIRAKSDVNYDHSLVKYVIISGSTNDITSSISSLTQNIQTVIDNIKSGFPNSELIYISGLCGSNVRWTDSTPNSDNHSSGDYRLKDWVSYLAYTANMFKDNGFSCIENSFIWLLFNSSKSNPDGLHPNDSGHVTIFNNVLSFLKGHSGVNPMSAGGVVSSSNLETYYSKNVTSLPYVISPSYYSFVFNPKTGIADVYIGSFTVTMSKSDVEKWANTKANDNIYSVKIPLFPKLIPIPQINTNESFESWPIRGLSVQSNIEAVNPRFVCVTNNSNITIPNESRRMLWLTFDYIPTGYKDGSPSNLDIDAGIVLKYIGGKISVDVLGGFR